MSDRAHAPAWLIRQVDDLADRVAALELRLAAGHEASTLPVSLAPVVSTQTERPR